MESKVEKVPDRVKINTARLDTIEKDLYEKDKGVCDRVDSHDGNILFFSRFLKFLAWFVGVSMAMLMALFGFILNTNYELIKQVAALTAKIIEHIGSLQ